MPQRHPELRAHPRAPFAEEVRYFEWDRARLAEATEISVGGLFLATPAPLAEGRLLTVRIRMAGGETGFTALARVVRTVRGGTLRVSGMGLRFIDLPAHGRRLIADHVGARRAA